MSRCRASPGRGRASSSPSRPTWAARRCWWSAAASTSSGSRWRRWNRGAPRAGAHPQTGFPRQQRAPRGVRTCEHASRTGGRRFPHRARAAPDRARDRRVSRPHRLQRPSGARAAAAQRLRRHGLRHRHGRDGRVRADGGGAAARRDRLDAHPARVRPRFRFRPAARHGGRRGWVPHQEGVRLRTAALRGQHGDLAAEGGSLSGRPIRVLVADDSTTLRTALVALLSEDPSLAIVGQAADGVEAVEKARALRPDVITMDVNMPRLDGLGATAAIMAEAPSRVLVITSVRQHRQLELSFKAMAAGALELIAKPEGGPEEMRHWAHRVAESVRLMAEVPVVRRHRSRPTLARPQLAHGAQVDVVGMAASTGGPPALAHVLGALPRDLPVPLLLAQHIATGFSAGLVRWFASVCSLRVVIAQDGDLPVPGTVYLPPDGCDLELGREGRIHAPRSSGLDRKSTRLNSSHLVISYAVFCLKKKKIK